MIEVLLKEKNTFMKYILFRVVTLITFLILITLPNSFAQDGLFQSRVRLIYFLPKDRPPRPERKIALRELILDTQEAFADQMEAHGFSRKTFILETNRHRKPVVHHVNGKFNHAYYTKDMSYKVLDEIDEQFDRSKDFYFIVIDWDRPGLPHKEYGIVGGLGNMTNSHSGWVLIPASGHNFNVRVAVHELGHAFGLNHDLRIDAKHIPPSIIPREHTTSFCAAEWFDVHSAFNRSQTAVNQPSTIEMLPLTLASAPNVIRLRFRVADPDGIHHVHLNKNEPSGTWLIGCRLLGGTRSSIVEFVTDYVGPKTDSANLRVMDVHGNIEQSQSYPINITSLLPRAEVVSIPDAKLAMAIRRKIGNSITTHTILNLQSVDVLDEVVTDLTGLEHAHNLIYLRLGNNRVSDFSVLEGLTKLLSFSGSISDVSVLPKLPNLRLLYLEYKNIADISSLSGLTQLSWLNLQGNNISDISALSELTQLTFLKLKNNNISDVSALSGLTQLTELNVRENPLSYASVHTYIPAMQARGVEVKFNKRTHPALVKISGNEQAGEVGTTLAKPFVVKVVNARGKPMKGVRVTFAVTSGGGTLSSIAGTTDAKGRGRTTLRLGSTVGMNTVTITAKGIRSSVIFNAQATGPPVYWVDTNTGTLHRWVGNIVENLVPRVKKATSLAVDTANGKFYWTEQTSNRTGKIRRANLDGSNIQLIKNLTSVPLNLAIDVANSKLYMANSWGKIQRMNFDGSRFEPNLITGLDSPKGIALDAVSGKLYWIEQTGKAAGKIQRANLDGSNVEPVKSLMSVPLNLAIDVANSKLYMANSWGKIQRMNFDGSRFEPNLITGLDSPEGIAVDVRVGKLYWTEIGSISCANLNGENVENIITDLGTPANIVLGTSLDSIVAAPMNTRPAPPNTTDLLANYPNPFNPETWIPYELAENSQVLLTIYATTGEVVRTLSLGHQSVGRYVSRSRAAYWDGRNELGEPVASGVYFYTLTAGDFTATRKMLILK